VRGQGHSNFLLKRWPERAKQGKILQPVVLLNLQGKGPVRQRSLSADLIFWLLFYQEKSNSPPRQMSGASQVRWTNQATSITPFTPQKVRQKLPIPQNT